MGFFDIFKKSNKSMMPEHNKPKVEIPSFETTFKPTQDGRLQVDFFDRNAEFSKFYDTTRLIVNGNPIKISGHDVYECMVSWYGDSDCQMLNKETGEFESLRACDYRNILAQIDLDLLQTNPDYCKQVMKNLLDRRRVERYIDTGLQEKPNHPCGNYIGGVIETEQGYRKYFSQTIGERVHNSTQMIRKRQEYRELKERARQQQIRNKQAQISQLQDDIKGLNAK